MVKTTGRVVWSQHVGVDYAVVFFAAAAIYILTCAPGVVWQDGGMIQYRVWHNDIEGRLGLALSHPLYYLIAICGMHIIPGEPAWRVNVTTALISAAAVANMFLFLRLWLKRVFPAVLGAVTLGLSHTFWWHATTPETYNLAAALLLCELVMLVQFASTARVGYLYALALVNGLAVANHMLASIAFVCYLVLVVVLAARRRIIVRDIAVMALLWAVGALPYEYLVVRSIVDGGDLWAVLSSAAFGASWQADVLNASLTGKIVRENLMWMGLNYPTPNIVLLPVGLWAVYRIGPRRWLASVLMALAALYLVFAFRYTVPDRYVFFIPFYCMASILIGAGTGRVDLRRGLGRLAACVITVCSLLGVPLYILAPTIAKTAGIAGGRARVVPYRDDREYFLQPWKVGYRGSERFAFEALEEVGPGSIILADPTTAPPLLYVQQVWGKRPDVKIICSFGESEGSPRVDAQNMDGLLAERTVYVVSAVPGYCPAFLLDGYDFAADGVLQRVTTRKMK